MKICKIFIRFGILLFLNADSVFNQVFAPFPVELLNGKHLRVIWPKWEGNPPGMSGPLTGKLVIDYLAARFHFTYEFVSVTENWLEPLNKTVNGQFSYLWNDKADLLIAQIVRIFGRQRLVDFTCPSNYDKFALLIPVSDDASSNTQAIIKPFQWPIWLALLLSIVLVINVYRKIQDFRLDKDIIKPVNRKNKGRTNSKTSINSVLFVLGILLGQGGPDPKKRLSIRLIAGVWCLAAFVFVSAYNSTLITYVLAPINYPLVNSLQEAVDRSDVILWIRNSGTMDNLMRTSQHLVDPLLMEIKSKVNSSPKSRCSLVSDCVNQVKPGTKNVFGDATTSLKTFIKERFLATGKCEIEIKASDFISFTTSYGLQKGSPYTSSISKGVNELRENGLLEYWEALMRQYPPQCLAAVNGLAEKQVKKDGPRRLSLTNLTGAFIVLLIGMAISFLSFLCEVLFSIHKKPLVT